MRTFYDEITKIAGNVVTVKAQGIGYDDLAVITTGHSTSLAQVIRVEDDQVSLQIFGGTEGAAALATPAKSIFSAVDTVGSPPEDSYCWLSQQMWIRFFG